MSDSKESSEIEKHSEKEKRGKKASTRENANSEKIESAEGKQNRPKKYRRRGELGLENQIKEGLLALGIVHEGVTQALVNEIRQDEEKAQKKADQILADAKIRAEEVLATAKKNALEKALEADRVVKKLGEMLATSARQSSSDAG